MSPALRYSLARFGLLFGVFLLLLPIPGLSVLVKALLALLITMPLAWFLLRKWREQASLALAKGVQRRRVRRERLRDALAGYDERAGSERAAEEPAAEERAAEERAAEEPAAEKPADDASRQG